MTTRPRDEPSGSFWSWLFGSQTSSVEDDRLVCGYMTGPHRHSAAAAVRDAGAMVDETTPSYGSVSRTASEWAAGA